MKLDERDEQQSEGDKQTKCNREILREKKSAEAKNPRHHDHDVELACGVRFQDLDRRQHNNEGNAGLDSPERAVAKEQQGQDQGHENQFPNQGAETITFRFHPELRGERDQKQQGHPGRETPKHWRQCKKQRRCQRQERSSRDAWVLFAKNLHLKVDRAVRRSMLKIMPAKPGGLASPDGATDPPSSSNLFRSLIIHSELHGLEQGQFAQATMEMRLAQ